MSKKIIVPVAYLTLKNPPKTHMFVKTNDNKIMLATNKYRVSNSGFIIQEAIAYARCADCVPTRREFDDPVDIGCRDVYRYRITITCKDGTLRVFGTSFNEEDAIKNAEENLNRMKGMNRK